MDVVVVILDRLLEFNTIALRPVSFVRVEVIAYRPVGRWLRVCVVVCLTFLRCEVELCLLIVSASLLHVDIVWTLGWEVTANKEDIFFRDITYYLLLNDVNFSPDNIRLAPCVVVSARWSSSVFFDRWSVRLYTLMRV